MVATRSHPEPLVELSPPSKSSKSRHDSPREIQWTHTPSNFTLIWLAISLPLVIWDTGYVLLRPDSMPGGYLHSPIWSPYELYGRVDYMYGWKAFNEHNGFTSAQGTLNVIETVMYLYYAFVVYMYGKESSLNGKGAPSTSLVGKLGQSRAVSGKVAASAVLVAFSASVMTFSKTLLYWLNEYFSGFENIGHNKPTDLFVLWIIPNGAWLVVPVYLIYVFGAEIIQGLAVATDKKQL